MSTANLRKRLVQIDVEIVKYKSAISWLEQHRVAVQHQLHAIARFPVLTLPIEITAEIFSLCLPTIRELRENGHSAAESFKSPPMLFTAVCRTWREIAIAMPPLWAKFQLRLDTVTQRVASEPEMIEEFIEQWLGRAASRPLSIMFHTSRYWDDDYTVTTGRLRDIIHRYAPRIAYLELHSTQNQIRELALDSAAFPQLQRACIGDLYSPAPDPLNPVNIFSNAPRLAELKLFDSAVYSSYTLPSLQLTKFEGEIKNLELFSLAPNLVEVECSVEYLENDPPSVISHPRLESLTLSESPSGVEPENILPHLALPALHSLDIAAIVSDEIVVPLSLGSFLARSTAPLRTLVANVNKGSYYDWVEQRLSHIEDTLENLMVYNLSETFLHGVMSLGSELPPYPCFPRLQHLSLKNSPNTNYKLLVDFLYKRSTSVQFAKLRSFHLTCENGTFLDDAFYVAQPGHVGEVVDHLAELASAGMDICIHSHRAKPHVNHVRSRESC
ncbi:hypothetical protein DFH07DRAFT_953716 [Mycena maculata]|uniref:F-box domain-containing protein n=1 Tax=Mycena maculata TaxID=230809 RepID=A0AAD7JSK8_9AGAR|nr:hypothetical protein DFH07DRAFT_953716 [Mycena maculata]